MMMMVLSVRSLRDINSGPLASASLDIIYFWAAVRSDMMEQREREKVRGREGGKRREKDKRGRESAPVSKR